MNIGKSLRIAIAKKNVKTSWVAVQLAVTPERVRHITQQTDCSTKLITRMSEVFDMIASEFIALGEEQ